MKWKHLNNPVLRFNINQGFAVEVVDEWNIHGFDWGFNSDYGHNLFPRIPIVPGSTMTARTGAAKAARIKSSPRNFVSPVILKSWLKTSFARGALRS
jgi:hypothetical protein